ncbi:thioredoxin reductase [Coemansia reversa NRRL 1564]|uniref:Thioredoxin reductase n=1 Tax=Coemansia reversa (strain ATCC 12441 / NRRL 1564) TaxID=763665 RepID=A0A2G5BIB9_COERN|nr:thioredoxin reductase [Coemansia reversa NRRL 1564]|eukprot:PIA18774.1 thioredoxin reductase [Coemansia reversa NRRL 1564]
MHRKVIIVGSGPAGHTAAIYAARANLEPMLFEGMMAGDVAPGGQLTTTTDVENFPGFPEGVMGSELTDKFREQSVRFGTEIVTETVTRVDLGTRPFKLWREGADDDKDEADTCDALIIATGATAMRLHIKGEDEYWQRGMSACAVCDGAAPIFRNKRLVVIGGGDSACEEATFLTKYASHVFIAVRRDVFRASSIMAKRAMNNPKITVLWKTHVIEAKGDGNVLTHVVLQDAETKQCRDLEVSGLFYAIGHTPNTAFLGSQIEADATGYLLVKPGSTVTNIPGVFAAGDVQDKRYRQAITAAGSGCMSALDAEKYLEDLAAEEQEKASKL